MAIYCLQKCFGRFLIQIGQPRPCHPGLTGSPLGNFHQSGYTLLELVTSLAILCILSGMGMRIMSVIHSTQATTITNTFVRTLHLARSEAIRRQHRVTLCQSRDSIRCSNGEDWESGWLLFSDKNRDHEIGENETIVHAHEGLPPGYTLSWRPSGRRRDYISFLPGGGTNKVGTFFLCSTTQKGLAKTIIVYRTGRIRTSNTGPGGKAPDCPSTSA